MSDYLITIYNLYPDLLNLCGDTGNVSVLKMRCQKREIEAEIKDIYANDTFDLSDADIVLIGGGGEREQISVSEMPIGCKLKEYAEAGGIILATCSGYQLLGNSFEANGETHEGFKVLDASSYATDEKHMGDFAIEAELDCKRVVLAGFQNHGFKTVANNLTPLGKVIFGTGDRDGAEGAVYKNVIATYMYGPILPKNPELADYLIKKALENKYENFPDSLQPLDDTAELLAKQFITDRNKGEVK